MGPTKSKRHFVFSVYLTPTNVRKMKDDLNQIFKLPTNIQILSFYVFNEDQIYKTEEKHKCPGKS